MSHGGNGTRKALTRGNDPCLLLIQDKMQLDRSFGLAELCPIIHGQTQIDHRGIQTDQLVPETKLLPSMRPGHLFAATLVKIEKYLLIKLPGAMLIGIRTK